MKRLSRHITAIVFIGAASFSLLGCTPSDSPIDVNNGYSSLSTGGIVSDYPAYSTLDEAIYASDAIVVGRFIAEREDIMTPVISTTTGDAETNPQYGLDLSADEIEQMKLDLATPITIATVRVEQVISGNVLPGTEIEVSQVGGVLNGTLYLEHGTTLLSDLKEKELVLFLHGSGINSTFSLINPDVGVWLIDETGLSPVAGNAPFEIDSLRAVEQITTLLYPHGG